MKSRCEKTVVIIYFLVIPLSVVVGQQCNGGANCIPLNDCQGLYSLLQRNNFPQLSKLLQGLHCGFQGDVPKICCPPQFLFPNDDRTNEPKRRLRFSRELTSLLPDERIRGIQNNERTVDGVQTDLDEHPWMALLRYEQR